MPRSGILRIGLARNVDVENQRVHTRRDAEYAGRHYLIANE